ncbi:MAG: hypothetical protein KF729_30360 [Sandaracinaceae bacterium]|nr:hypothetical protein [Sandaracinaceae bacterium]
MSKELEERIAALEARLDAVERRPPERATMKERRRCPSCGGTELYFAPQLVAQLFAGIPFALGVRARAVGRAQTTGDFEAYACTRCGLVEWHAKPIDPALAARAGLTRIEPPPDDPRGPYR